MPIHDWTKVTAGTFHAFHAAWIPEIQKCLNGGVLPDGYYAMAEQVAGNTIPDVLTLQDVAAQSEDAGWGEANDSGGGGLALATAPPQTSIHETLDEARTLAARRRRIVIRHTTGDRIVALLEVVSPGNKSSADSAEQFADKAAAALNAGFHLIVIDLFQPGTFDPQGMHGKIWGILGGKYTHPADKPLTLAAYMSRGPGPLECFVEPTSVDSILKEMPLFLSAERYVNVPLEETYMAAYVGVPKRWKRVIEATQRGISPCRMK
jgi:hypothetical protein